MAITSDADLRALRGILSTAPPAESGPHHCTLERPQVVTIPGGGSTIDWVSYAVNVPCRLSPITGTELPRGAAATPETNYRLALPFGWLPEAMDRAVVIGRTKDTAWTATIGFTFIEIPKSWQAETLAYGSDKMEQISESIVVAAEARAARKATRGR
jgi:hypothetical protein